MKKLLFTTMLMAITISAAFAQSSNDELEIIQSLFGMEKKAAVADFLQLEVDASESFWQVYDSYEVERKALGKKRVDLLNKYADQYLELDDEKTEALMKETIALSKSYEKLIVSYYKKVKKSNGVKTATQFYQIELFLKSYIRTVIFSSLPFVGEFE